MDRLVWIDCEMTGLDLAQDRLLEVACLVTDAELTVLDEGLDLVLGAPKEALDAMVPVVRDMHAASGLTDAVRQSTISLAEAEERLLTYVRGHVPDPRKAPLCGNTIATDRAFLVRDMPALDSWLHYRMIDVSSVKELCRRWYPRAYFAAPVKRGGHRALADIWESVQELRYYRSAIFVSVPGPSSEEARQIAAAIRQEDGAGEVAGADKWAESSAAAAADRTEQATPD
ncbi:MAG: oligoribonuclease [Frankiaceae bacterium]